MVDYDALARTAETLIQNNGRVVTFIKLDATPTGGKKYLPPADPRAVPAASEDLSAVFVSPSSAAKLGIISEQSDFVKESEQIAIVGIPAGWSEDLRTFQEVIDGTVPWRIAFVEELKPGTTTLIYIVGVKR